MRSETEFIILGHLMLVLYGILGYLIGKLLDKRKKENDNGRD